MMALTPIPLAGLTPLQLRSTQEFSEFQSLRELRAEGTILNEAQRKRLGELSDREKMGELKSFFSYTDPVPLYLLFALVVGGYTIMGGLRAAVLSDSFPG
jgi:SSS family solute:Na+ symporter